MMSPEVLDTYIKINDARKFAHLTFNHNSVDQYQCDEKVCAQLWTTLIGLYDIDKQAQTV